MPAGSTQVVLKTTPQIVLKTTSQGILKTTPIKPSTISTRWKAYEQREVKGPKLKKPKMKMTRREKLIRKLIQERKYGKRISMSNIAETARLDLEQMESRSSLFYDGHLIQVIAVLVPLDVFS